MSEAGSSRCVVKPFDGTNFHAWKFRVEKLLDEYGVLGCVNEDGDVNRKHDRKAMSTIVQYWMTHN